MSDVTHLSTESSDFLSMRVAAMRWEAEDIVSVELSPLDGKNLPAFTAGAHIDLRLPGGITRSYSLINEPTMVDRYRVAVALDAASRGGSRYVHQQLRVGQVLQVGASRNDFPLVDCSAESVLIAGGIGVTPILAMMLQLAAGQRPYSVYYAARSAARAAFLSRMNEVCGKKLTVHLDDEHGGKPIDISAIVQGHRGAHFYCCGPTPMLATFEAATATLPPETIHVEYFVPKARASAEANTTFKVVLARSGLELTVPPDQTVLQVVRAAGLEPATSCEQGVCGTCETRIIEGVADHRDCVLTSAEKESGQTMMICVSRAKTSRLVLDL